ncbi:MAG: hypothetical protein U0791_06115 [Gemmataceae bacterium]
MTLDLFPFGKEFTGGVNVAVGKLDLNGDGMIDIVASVASGGGPRVVVLDGKSGVQLQSFFAFEPSFTGGVNVAVGALVPGGEPSIIVAPGAGGGPAVAVFDAHTGSALRRFFAYDPSFRGGVSVAFGAALDAPDTEIVAGAGPGGGPHVKVFSGLTGKMTRSFYAFESTFTGGVNVALGEFGEVLYKTLNIVAAAASGGGPRVVVLDAMSGAVQRSFFVFSPSFSGGVRVAAFGSTLLVGPALGGTPQISIFLNPDGVVSDTIPVFRSSFLGGLTLAEVPTLVSPPIV